MSTKPQVPPEGIFSKDPDEIQDYAVDYVDIMGADADLIITGTWITPAGITVLAEFLFPPDTRHTIFVTGGTRGQDYYLTSQVDTTGSRRFHRSIQLKIFEK